MKNSPPALALQLDRCDICGDKVQRRQLVRTQVEYLQPAANNYIIQSTYDASHWTTDDTAALGNISVGPHADWQRLAGAYSLDKSNALTEFQGVATFSTEKTVYTTVSMDDPSSWDNLVFSAFVGPYHRSTTPETTLDIGVFDVGTWETGIGTKFSQRTWVTSGMQRIWWSATPAELSADGVTLSTLGFYVTGTGSSWFMDKMQVEKNATKPDTFIATSGSTASIATDSTYLTVRKACGSCKERILSKSEQYGRPDGPTVDEPVSTWTQDI